MSGALADFRYALRRLRRRPSFPLIAAVTLGLGIGVLAALFAVVDAVLLQPVVPEQHRVVRVWKDDAAHGLERHPIAYPEFLEMRAQARSFAALAAINYADTGSLALEVGGRPARVSLTPVSSHFFETLVGGAAPLHGRWLAPADERPGAELAAVASEGFWRRMAGGDPAFVGRRLAFAGSDRTVIIVGIAAATLDYPLGTDLWVPIARFFGTGAQSHISIEDRRAAQFELIGRLAPRVAPEVAREELGAIHRRLVDRYPADYAPMRLVVTPILDTVAGDSREVLTFLLVAGGLVFAIAGVNVATLLLMRAGAARRERAVRLALGAGRGRLAREAIADSLLIGGLGAIAGLAMAGALLVLVRWLGTAVPRIEQAALDLRVVGVATAAALAWALLLGTAPVWRPRATAVDVRSADLSVAARRRTSGLRLFIVAQIAAAVVVAIGAGLLLRSLANLRNVDRGFRSQRVITVPLLLPPDRYPDARARLSFFEALVARLEAMPGVVAASPVHMQPGTGSVGLSAGMMFEGQTRAEADLNPWATWEPVTPSYFRVLGVPIVRGRAFGATDSRDSAPVAIVSEAVARRYWPGQDALGRRLRFTSQFPWATVIGIAGDVRYRELTRPWLTVYFPASQFFFFSPGSLVVRTAGPPQVVLPAVREVIRGLEPAVPLEPATLMEDLLARELSHPRAAMAVAALFALLAIVLAAVGIYGVISHEVAGSRRELAVRSALGASPASLFGGVLLRSGILGVIGIAAGVFAALLATRVLASLLFGVAATDPAVFAGGAAVLLTIVLLASVLPARRAARVDPILILRAE